MATPAALGAEFDALDEVAATLPDEAVGAAIPETAPATAPATPATRPTRSATAAARRRDALYRRLLAGADLAAMAFALCAGVLLASGASASPYAVLAFPALVILAKALGLYDRDEHLVHKSTLEELPKLLQLSILVAFAVSLLQSPRVTPVRHGHLGLERDSNCCCPIRVFSARVRNCSSSR